MENFKELFDFDFDFKKSIKKRKWFAITSEFAEILTNTTFQQNEIRVLFYIANHMDTNNIIYIKQTELAKELFIDKTNLSKIIKKLIEKNIIKKTKKAKIYMINPEYLYFGDYTILKNKKEYYKKL